MAVAGDLARHLILKGGDVGVNMVMSGSADGSPILAYTDDTGHQLYVLNSALPARPGSGQDDAA